MSVADLYRNRGVNALAVQGRTLLATGGSLIYYPAPDNNYSTITTIQVSRGAIVGQVANSFLVFDFTSIPAYSRILTATLLVKTTATAAANRTFGVYRVIRTDFSVAQTTWNNYKTGAAWTTAGCAGATDMTTVNAAASASVAANTWQLWDVKGIIQDMIVTPTANMTIVIKDTAANADVDTEYHSPNAVSVDNRPRLQLWLA